MSYRKKQSPVTGARLPHKSIVPNHALRNSIQDLTRQRDAIIEAERRWKIQQRVESDPSQPPMLKKKISNQTSEAVPGGHRSETTTITFNSDLLFEYSSHITFTPRCGNDQSRPPDYRRFQATGDWSWDEEKQEVRLIGDKNSKTFQARFHLSDLKSDWEWKPLQDA